MAPAFQRAFKTRSKVRCRCARTCPSPTTTAAGRRPTRGDERRRRLRATSIGSNAHGHANPASIKNAIYDVITAEGFNGEYDAAEATQQLVDAVQLARTE